MSDLYPRLAYEDERAAVEWLTRVFGFKESTRKENPDGSLLVWLELTSGMVMVSRATFGLKSPRQLGGTSYKINAYVDDVDRHCAHATAEGAVIERPLENMPWGDRRYEAFDLEGHWWHFAQRLATAGPSES
jgi:uncharacterized glyoxalase superfamily protein PhnB